MQPSQLQPGIAIAQETQGDVEFFVPDRVIDVIKLTPAAIAALTFYDAIVGPALSPVVGYTSVQTAINTVPAGGTILILKGTYTETITLSQEVHLWGMGRSTILNGTVTIQSAASFSSILNLKFANSITLNGSCNGCFVQACWQSDGFVISNSGSANNVLIVQE